MAAGMKKSETKLDSDTEREIIDIWADILEEFNRKMLIWKRKETIATISLNAYMSEELNMAGQYTEKAISNNSYSILKKGKQMYITYQKKGETGKEYSQEDVEMDMKATELAWSNFKTFYTLSRTIQHWAQAQWMTQQWLFPVLHLKWWLQMRMKVRKVIIRQILADESMASNRSTIVIDDNDEEDDEVSILWKKGKGEETPLVARIGKNKGRQTGATQFLVAFAEMQESVR